MHGQERELQRYILRMQNNSFRQDPHILEASVQGVTLEGNRYTAVRKTS